MSGARTAVAGATAHNALASASVGELEEALVAARAAAVAAEPAQRIAGLRARVARQKQHLADAEAALAAALAELGE